MTSTPLHRAPAGTDGTSSARARALELLGAYTAEVPAGERRATLERVVLETEADPAALRSLVHALTEYAAIFADVAATATSGEVAVAPASLVHALARMDLTRD